MPHYFRVISSYHSSLQSYLKQTRFCCQTFILLLLVEPSSLCQTLVWQHSMPLTWLLVLLVYSRPKHPYCITNYFLGEEEHLTGDEIEDSSDSEYDSPLTDLSALNGYSHFDKGCIEGNCLALTFHYCLWIIGFRFPDYSSMRFGFPFRDPRWLRSDVRFILERRSYMHRGPRDVGERVQNYHGWSR